MIETTAREWTNPSTGEVRNYVTNMTDLINNIPGWEVTYWGTGTVKAILRNGMELSKRETANLRNAKAWIDGAGEIHIESYAEAITVEQFTEAVRVGMPAPVETAETAEVEAIIETPAITARLSAPHPLDGGLSLDTQDVLKLKPSIDAREVTTATALATANYANTGAGIFTFAGASIYSGLTTAPTATALEAIIETPAITARLSAPHPLDGAREVADLAELLAAAGHTLTREEENSCRYSRTWITADGTIKSLARLDRIGGRATVQTVVSEALR